MTSYLSNLLTTTTNKYTALRRTLLPDENDGDTEDDTHISRCLRAYYVEKQRPFPAWLPPDPNDRRPAAPPQPAYGSQYTQGGAYFQGGRNAAAAGSPAPNRRAGGGLNDLWDSGPAQPPPQPQSLRARPAAPSPQPSYSSQSSASARADRYAAGQSARLGPGGARPLPSQREGSYQSRMGGAGDGEALSAARAAGAASGAAPPQISRATSTQDRLKARLWGAGAGGAPGGGGGGYGGGGGGGYR